MIIKEFMKPDLPNIANDSYNGLQNAGRRKLLSYFGASILAKLLEGANQAFAQQTGYIAFKWCQPNPPPATPEEDFDFYAWKVQNINDPEDYKTGTVNKNVTRANVCGLRVGEIYQITLKSCKTIGICSPDTTNKPEAVAILPGNLDHSSTSATTNTVTSHDNSLLYQIYMGKIQDANKRKMADSDCNYVIDSREMSQLRLNLGKIQFNLMGTAYGRCDAQNCPEIDIPCHSITYP